MSDRLPLPVAAFGFAGLLPPALAAAAVALLPAGGWQQLAWVGLIFYAALIFSFLGGTWWAFAAREPRPRTLAVWLLLAVTPSLLGLALLLLLLAPATRALATPLLAAAIFVSPLVDRALSAAGLTPGWWMKLRVPLSVGLAACVAVAAWRVPLV
jgi:putative flippase GtrA